MNDITPDRAAAELASGFLSRTPEYILDRAISAMATISTMAEEVEYRIVNLDADSGRYEMRRYVRYVTDWGVGE